MNVLQLEGESAQLRQVAKAFAAGDISRDDYRQIRTAIIDAFVLDNSSVTLVTDDDGKPEAIAVEPIVEPSRVKRARTASPPSDVGWSLLAIVGAGAMLVIVAMLAILLS